MKKGLLMFALVMSAVFVGNTIGEASLASEGMSWLGQTYVVGLAPFDVDLHLCVLTFGLQFKVCIAEVLMILVALFTYPKLSKMIFG